MTPCPDCEGRRQVYVRTGWDHYDFDAQDCTTCEGTGIYPPPPLDAPGIEPAKTPGDSTDTAAQWDARHQSTFCIHHGTHHCTLHGVSLEAELAYLRGQGPGPWPPRAGDEQTSGAWRQPGTHDCSTAHEPTTASRATYETHEGTPPKPGVTAGETALTSEPAEGSHEFRKPSGEGAEDIDAGALVDPCEGNGGVAAWGSIGLPGAAFAARRYLDPRTDVARALGMLEGGR